ncbi:DNA topoisomerase IB [Cupriavidus basilensis]
MVRRTARVRRGPAQGAEQCEHRKAAAPRPTWWVAWTKTPRPHCAKQACHYVDDSMPGITRRRRGSGFAYVDAHGNRVRDAATLARIAALAIPPAYESVWICADANGHPQATWPRCARPQAVRLSRGLGRAARHRQICPTPGLRRGPAAAARRVERDLTRNGMPREKVAAAVVRLLDATLVRVGTPRYARQNRTYGLTTLRPKHVTVRGSRLRFQSAGKSGITHDVSVNDPRVARIVRNCAELPGQCLFKYIDSDGEVRDIGSADVNAYLRDITGGEFTAKDFRTWAGSVHALALLRKRHAKRRSRTRSAARPWPMRSRPWPSACAIPWRYAASAIVHPAVIEAFLSGGLEIRPAAGTRSRLRADEARLLQLLAQTSLPI